MKSVESETRSRDQREVQLLSDVFGVRRVSHERGAADEEAEKRIDVPFHFTMSSYYMQCPGVHFRYVLRLFLQ